VIGSSHGELNDDRHMVCRHRGQPHSQPPGSRTFALPASPKTQRRRHHDTSMGTFSLEAELLLQSDKRALECTQDRAAEQRAVEQAGDRAAGLVLDGQPVDESVTVRLEVALVIRVG
jgi:hypothetical protein